MNKAVDSVIAPVDGAHVPSVAPGAIARWAALLGIVYLAFCWLAWNRTLLPDEIWALITAEKSWSEQLASIRADLVHPPLFYVVERAWIGLFGGSELSVKSLPVLINLLAIGLFPVLAARLTRSWRLASLLYLTVYLHVFSAPNLARMYGLVLLLTIASIWAWDVWRYRPTSGRLLIWVTIMSLAVLTHYFGAFLLASFVLVGWWMGPKPNSLTFAATLPALIFGAWVIYVFPVYADRGLASNLRWVEPSLVRAVSIVSFHFLSTIPSGGNPVHPDWWAGLPGMRFLVVGAAAVNLLLVAFAFANRSQSRVDWRWLGTLTVLLCAPPILFAGASLLVGPAFDTRFLVGSLPVYWLWVVVLSELGGTPGRLFLRIIVLPVSLLAVILPLRQDLTESPLRDAVRRIVDDRKPGDLVLSDNQVGSQSYWELRRAGQDIPIASLPKSEYFATFAAPPEIPDRVWVICRGECNRAIGTRLREHVVVLRHGRYLALYERRH